MHVHESGLSISISVLSPLVQSRTCRLSWASTISTHLTMLCAPGCRWNTLRGGKCVGHLQAVCRRQPLPAVPGPLLISWGSRLKERLRLVASQAARGERLSGSWQVGCRPERTLSARRSLLLEQHHRGGWRHPPVLVSTSNPPSQPSTPYSPNCREWFWLVPLTSGIPLTQNGEHGRNACRGARRAERGRHAAHESPQ